MKKEQLVDCEPREALSGQYPDWSLFVIKDASPKPAFYVGFDVCRQLNNQTFPNNIFWNWNWTKARHPELLNAI